MYVVNPLIGVTWNGAEANMNKLCTVGAILCAIATVASAFRGHPLSFLLFMVCTAAFLFMLTDN